MEVTIAWEGDKKNVVRYTFSGKWDWREFYAAFGEPSTPYCGSNTCVIIDLRQTLQMPSDAVLHLRKAAELANNISGVVVVIATNMSVITMYRLFVTIYHSVRAKFRLASDDVEAARILGVLTPGAD